MCLAIVNDRVRPSAAGGELLAEGRDGTHYRPELASKTTFDIGARLRHARYNNVEPEWSVEVALKKMGNSTALVIPPPVLKDLGIGVGQHLTLDTTPDGKIVLTPKRKYVLADLIAQCDPKAPLSSDLALWDVARPVGGEVL